MTEQETALLALVEEVDALLSDFDNRDFQKVGFCGYVLNDRAADIIRRLRAAILSAPASEAQPPYGAEVLCETCAKVFCPHGEPMHFHHNGCPACESAPASRAQSDICVGPAGGCPVCYSTPCTCRARKRRKAHPTEEALEQCSACGQWAVVPSVGFCMRCRHRQAASEARTFGALQVQEPKRPVLDALHDVFTRHGIASRQDLPPSLIGDVIRWAADECRYATRNMAPAQPTDRALLEKLANAVTIMGYSVLPICGRFTEGKTCRETRPDNKWCSRCAYSHLEEALAALRAAGAESK